MGGEEPIYVAPKLRQKKEEEEKEEKVSFDDFLLGKMKKTTNLCPRETVALFVALIDAIKNNDVHTLRTDLWMLKCSTRRISLVPESVVRLSSDVGDENDRWEATLVAALVALLGR